MAEAQTFRHQLANHTWAGSTFQKHGKLPRKKSLAGFFCVDDVQGFL